MRRKFHQDTNLLLAVAHSTSVHLAKSPPIPLYKPPLIHLTKLQADEALAVHLLRLTHEYSGASVTRSRDPEVLEKCDIIVDVTGIYDEVKHFDHHQRTFTGTFSPNHVTKLSSAGLIYKHFGKEIIATYTSQPVDAPSVETLYQKLYSEFIEAIDANDNGISAYPSSAGPPAFSERGITLPSLVGGLNPRWNEKITDDLSNSQFEKASKLMVKPSSTN